MSGDTDRKTAALHALAREKHEQSGGHTRRQLLRASAVAGAGAISLTAATGSAAAAPTGTFPATSDDPLLKFRADRLRLVERSGAPSSPSSGRVLLFTDSGDL